MTAINVIQTDDAIHFFSDGAYIDPRTNCLVATGQKVFAFPHARCAIGISGPMDLCRSLSTAGLLCQTIDQVVSDVEAILPELIKIVLDGLPPLNCGIYVGGISAAGERQFYKLDAKTTDRSFKFVRCTADCWNYEPRLTRHSIVMAMGEDGADEFDRGFLQRLSVADPVAHGLLALEAQRCVKVSDATLAGGSAYTVGAFAQVTSVYADRIESRILKRWSDQIGATISPEGAPKIYQAGFGKMSYRPRHAIGFKGANDSANAIDTGSSSNYAVNSSDGYVAPSVTAGSDQIPTMTSGTTSGVTISATGNDGSQFPWLAGDKNNSTYWQYVTSVAFWQVDFGSERTIATVTMRMRSDAAVMGPRGFRILGSATGAWAGEEVVLSTQTSLSWSNGETKTFNIASPGAYQHYGIDVTQNGSSGINVGFAEVTMVSQGTTNNMTLVTAAQTTDSSVANARVLLEYDATDSPTLNTDLTVEVTCDGGSNWSAGTLAEFSSHLQDGHHGAETELISCTAGTSVAARIKTANGKNIPIHALALSWE